jgi:hypothetical protein
MDEQEAIANAEAYAARNQLQLIERAGSGIHGIVFFVAGKTGLGTAVIKAHLSDEAYRREQDVYRRVMQLEITQIRGFEVPALLDADDALRILKLTLVMPPFLLDFASAHLNRAPEFSQEIWDDWQEKNREQFGDDWPMAQMILAELEGMGIYMLDPSPSNIRFR